MPDSDTFLVRPLARLDLVRDPAPWDVAEANRPVIDAHFAACRARNPALWDGRVLLLARHEIVEHPGEGATLRGAYKETDFSAFLWWRDAGFPDPAIRNAFAMGALMGADGAFVLGRMADWTANAGRVYFAAGTPEPGDVTPAGEVDLAGSVLRELEEETGLTAADVAAATGWEGVFAGPRIALMRRLVSTLEADALAARIRAHIAAEERSELADAVVARGPDDITDTMPPFIQTYLRAVWNVPAAG